MLIQESDLVLYNLTLKRQTNYIFSCVGNFVNFEHDNNNNNNKKNIQLCLATENHIELYDLSNGSMKRILDDIPLWAILKSMNKLSLPNNQRNNLDYLIVTSDAGNFSILKFVIENNANGSPVLNLLPVSIVPMTRSGVRRLSPIEFLAIDNHARCIMVSALEKFKFIYLLNTKTVTTTNNIAPVEISSPLEATRSNFITLKLTNCNTELFDNPCFASIEMDMTSTLNKFHLIFYNLDLNLNHIIKKADYLINDTVNYLMALPNLEKFNILTKINESNGRGMDSEATNPFVLIGFENYFIIKDLNGYFNIKVNLPYRNSTKDKKNSQIVIISSVTQILRNDFFILLQTNMGDLFKLKIIPDMNDRNRPKVIINYFDTIPLAEQLQITPNGLLFANNEFNNNYLFQFENLGSDHNQTSFDPALEGLSNLSIIHQQKNLNPLLSSNFIPSETLPFKLITNPSDSKIEILQNSVNLIKLISSPLPPNPKDIWTLKLNSNDRYHKLLVLAFNKSTVFLKIAGDSIQNLVLPTKPKSPFILKNERTIYMTTLAPNVIIQVCENQFTQVASSVDDSEFKQIHQWFPPAGISIVSATSTYTQLIIALSNNDVIYFEINANKQSVSSSNSNSLIESTKILTMDSKIIKLSTDSNCFRSNFLVIATQDNQLVNIVSIDTASTNFLDIISFQSVTDEINDILLDNDNVIHIGLKNGIYVKSKFSKRDGGITDTFNKYIGNKEVTLSIVSKALLTLNDEEESDDEDDDEEHNLKDKEVNPSELGSCIVINSSHIWASYEYKQLSYVRPFLLPYGVKYMKNIIQFNTEDIQYNGYCSLSSTGELIIGKIQDFVFNNHWFNSKEISLLPEEQKSESADVDANEEEEEDGSDDEDDDIDKKIRWLTYQNRKIVTLDQDHVIIIENSATKCRISILNQNDEILKNSETQENFQILTNVKCLAATIVHFTKNTTNLIMSTSDGRLITYQIDLNTFDKKQPKTFDWTFIHETVIGETILAMNSFNNLLIVSHNGYLILYGLGKKQLLKKSITQLVPSITKVTALDVRNNERVCLGDIHESAVLLHFDIDQNVFIPIADDVVKRHVTSIHFIDDFTIIGGDKFGNIWTLRAPIYDTNKLPNLNATKVSSNIMECPYKFDLKNHYFINDIPMGFLVLPSLQLSDRSDIIYIGLQGTVGVLTPLLSKSQIQTIKKIEDGVCNIEGLISGQEHRETNIGLDEEDNDDEVEIEDLAIDTNKLKTQKPEGYSSLVGRDHCSYRGYYEPVRAVIDGDLCEKFINLGSTDQRLISKNINKKITSTDVIKLINEIRTNYI